MKYKIGDRVFVARYVSAGPEDTVNEHLGRIGEITSIEDNDSYPEYVYTVHFSTYSGDFFHFCEQELEYVTENIEILFGNKGL